MVMASEMVANILVSFSKNRTYGAIIRFKCNTSVMMLLDNQRMRHIWHFPVMTERLIRRTSTVTGMECLTDGKSNIVDGLVLVLLVVTTGH